MNRINVFRNDSIAWGKTRNIANSTLGTINVLVFATVLVVCSIAVGCSSDKPKPVSSNHQIPVTQSQVDAQLMPAPVMAQPDKPAPKKSAPRKPRTVNYTDKTYGVTFEYPRRYAIETGDAAANLLLSSPIPMNFVQPGGVALAAVELPETNYANTDFSSAFFNVSINKSLTADQCTEFAVPQPKPEAKSEVKPEASADAKPEVKSDAKAEVKSDVKPDAKPAEVQAEVKSEAPATTTSTPAAPANDPSKLLLGDLELRATEAVSGQGTRQSDSKYFHVYQNGACYEFGLNVTTVASEQGVTKHVDRDKVFSRLERILSTVKISPVAPEQTAEVPAEVPATPVSETPAQ